ncbi:hypothetical protein HBI56_088450 [Parastagonospora nodorum]|uniref:Uncharacterized protein n=1 Tax=Phaeosphaeria nodorum (strain SN15 / ATCC MYA-4574 / FGSC 10173) TaxID=321614 RepID=A0A7U2FHW0_PHANO|nr:hypothetical protein HBH56_111020 [Parastagonospora nodorum]QRD03385.1 hypothetical protein JI435_419430 [Parastagonospora nodorum SN15]KAH3925667.1 hypothetical protein HBH54_179320 [Parastagonospora nodorum]KAH3951161.1 hypothetical protein HBH53_066710 [Parastagonospora nodorum]KAH3974448.1 hypothetical protein HBH51_091530 [Parastagonospora nodorum]
MELYGFKTLDVAYEFNDQKETSSAQESLHLAVAEALSNMSRALIATRDELEKEKL